MKLPIIIDEHGDLMVFSSKESAELKLEAIDVRNNEYIAYDSTGALLTLNLVPDVKKTMFGLYSVPLERVSIIMTDIHKQEELKNKLVSYLDKHNREKMSLENMELSELIYIVKKIAGVTH